MHETARKRGRPRPAETIARDTSITLMLYTDRSLREIAYLEKITPGQAYHALRRLQRAGQVAVIRRGKQHLWTRTQTATTHA